MAGIRFAASRNAASTSGSGGSTTGIRYESRPGGSKLGGGKLAAVDKATGKDVGHIEWGSNNDIWDVHVNKTSRRRGIATQLYRRAGRTAGGRLSHSENRTNAGDAFARSVGGHLPPRSSMFR